ncbi:MAG: hypothetical protein JW739_05270 [Opitutales bacterium]|nr:hypothetical protein [Opitutales bacterium]
MANPDFPMQKADLQPINVSAVFAGFETPQYPRRITPRMIHLRNGDTYSVAAIRRQYADRVGDALHIHFVLKTTDNRFLDIVYDSKKLIWFLVVELLDGLPD